MALSSQFGRAIAADLVHFVEADPIGRLASTSARCTILSSSAAMPSGAAEHIAAWAHANLDAADRSRFREMAEDELLGLHEGNFARYRIRPSEFQAWQEVWREMALPMSKATAKA